MHMCENMDTQDLVVSCSSNVTDSDSNMLSSSSVTSSILAATDKPKRRTKRTRLRSPETLHKIKKTRRNKANNRERTRMHDLNDALDTLRIMLPQGDEDTKLTKIETLRYAYNYILALKETLKILEEPEKEGSDSSLALENCYASAAYLLVDYANEVDPVHNTKLQSTFKPEPTWQYAGASTCLQYSPQQSAQGSVDSYDYYSEAGCSPQSSSCSPPSSRSCPDWNPGMGEVENSPTKYPNHQYHHYIQPSTMVMSDIRAALSHCH